MVISETQLETWSHQGAITTAKATHESIRNALNRYNWPNGVDFEVYLQGSYKNDTNIRGDSDVDVIVQLNSVFYCNLSYSERISLGLRDATYGWKEFRLDVLSALREYYDANIITEGNKSIKLKANSGRLSADIIVCADYKRYINQKQVADGITFWTRDDNRQIINYPKIHYDNGVEKNRNTKGWYKPTVRIIKNIRTYLIDNDIIEKDLAPSYFLECLIYNVPDEKFERSYQDVFCNVVNWLMKVDFNSFVCQCRQLPFFGETSEQWSIGNAKEFMQKSIELWNNR